jgi:general secretion pathway protein D
MRSAKRQVLIEATIVEVELSNNYKQGIEWARIASGLATGSVGTGIAISQAASGLFTLTGKNTTSSGGTFDGTIKLLEDYGNVKVLSSPKLSVMNNQTATLKVADNEVYFTMKADTTQNNGSSLTTYTTTPNSVTVGFIMTVTPQISAGDEVTINLRPTITRIVDYKKDPNPELKKVGVENLIPQIQTREMESIIKVSSGQTAVMGGLMHDELKNSDQGLPTLSSMPLFGQLFQQRDDKRKKTELVIFLRPVVIKDASIEGDYKEFRSQLPSQDFFEKGNIGPPQQRLNNPWGATQ